MDTLADLSEKVRKMPGHSQGLYGVLSRSSSGRSHLPTERVIGSLSLCICRSTPKGTGKVTVPVGACGLDLGVKQAKQL